MSAFFGNPLFFVTIMGTMMLINLASHGNFSSPFYFFLITVIVLNILNFFFGYSRIYFDENYISLRMLGIPFFRWKISEITEFRKAKASDIFRASRRMDYRSNFFEPGYFISKKSGFIHSALITIGTNEFYKLKKLINK